MSTADHILDQIDTALGDYAVGPDAMRCAPAPAGPRGKTTMAIMAADGEWQEIEGVTSIDFHIEPPAIDPEFAQRWQEMQENVTRMQIERARRAQAALEVFVRAYCEAVKPAVEAASRAFADLAQAVQQTGLADADGKPIPRRDRPAWQTPYGPAQRRRRR